MPGAGEQYQETAAERGVTRPAPNASSVVHSVETKYQALLSSIPELLDRAKILEDENRSLQADVKDQSNGRETWMKRAQKAEERQTAHPYLLAVLDGNDLCFRTRYIQAEDGANEAVTSLVREMRAHANLHHKYDLPKSIAVVVQIYVDLERLAEDLVTAEAIPEVNDLYAFTKALNSQPHISVIDCDHDNVQEKVKTAYELHLENCHCQHVVLGLGPSSEYYGVLEEYADDEYTMLKTSLIKPGGGLPGQYNLPFNVARLSAMHDVPLIPQFGDTVSDLQPAPIISASPFRATQRQQDPTPMQARLEIISESTTKSPTLHAPHSDKSEHKVSSQSGSVRSFPSSHTSSADREHDTAPKHASNTTSSHSSAPRHHHASDSPSRQHDWEIESQLSKLPDKLPSNKWPDQREDNPADYPPLPIPAKAPSHARHLSGAARRQAAVRSAWRGGRRRVPASPSPEHGCASPPKVIPTRAPPPISPSLYMPDIPLRNDVIRNKYGQRLDHPLPAATSDDHQAFAARSRQWKLCNRHHLTGSCTAVRCQFDHSAILYGVLIVLLHKARERPCVHGSDCHEHECPDGHVCPWKQHGFEKHGLHGYCPFKRVGIDVTDLRPDDSKTIRAQHADVVLSGEQSRRWTSAQATDDW